MNPYYLVLIILISALVIILAIKGIKKVFDEIN